MDCYNSIYIFSMLSGKIFLLNFSLVDIIVLTSKLGTILF